MHYLLPTYFGRCCDHHQCTFTRTPIVFKHPIAFEHPAERIEVCNAGKIALSKRCPLRYASLALFKRCPMRYALLVLSK